MLSVLVIGYVWPEPNSSAAGYHMTSLLRLFRQQGWRVNFASPAQKTEHMIDLQDEGISYHPIALNCSSFDQYVTELQPDIVMFDRFMMEEQFGWRVEKCCPEALRILDTEDLQCLRNARHHAIKKERKMEDGDLLSDLAKREIAAIFRCDLSLIISDFEFDLLQQKFKVPAAIIHHQPFLLDLAKLPEHCPGYADRQHFMMIGNFRHAPNWDSVLQMQKLWPEVRKRLKEQGHPEAELHIWGAYPPPKATALHNPKTGFLIKGWADRAYQVISSAKVCLAPLRFGAGIKGKLLDAMVCQTPSVTTAIGSEGMLDDEQHWPGKVADTDEAFIQAAVSLYSNQTAWEEANSYSRTVLSARYDGSMTGPMLINRIEAIKNNLQQHRLNNFMGQMLNHHSLKSTQYMSQWIEAKNKLESDQTA
ncbi:glycosyltransferase [Neptuniibacter caesariensis]|uniref:Putative glycosyltransferase n=1 Tax=Neptuniibacter caesariensis TaxID=207954 RepID=A0A7U8C5J5_NEPCE|nr:glycosyltransferase [Neptuniibacter caesariensis]EAR61664.1 putative glycosyltransferase [Neptuniibacter caesariensis]